jgi:hypothetical protein
MKKISQTIASTTPSTMEAFKLQKKYPEVSKDEMFDLINRFKCVYRPKILRSSLTLSAVPFVRILRVG